MNYQKIHDSIIERAKLRNLEAGVYYEKHHILARSVGGGNDAENLVLLTAKEHFVIHRLLFQVDSENRKLADAFIFLCNQCFMSKFENQQDHMSWEEFTSENKKKNRSIRLMWRLKLHNYMQDKSSQLYKIRFLRPYLYETPSSRLYQKAKERAWKSKLK
jgi:hypothetical protein